MYVCILCILNRNFHPRGTPLPPPKTKPCDFGYIAYIDTFVIY